MPVALPCGSLTLVTDRIRVWLEPGYDGGRFGVWMLDLPGCFVWRPDRGTALAAAAARAEQFVRWLAAHREAAPFQPSGREGIEVLEEVAPTWVGDYERNAAFAADRRPVSNDELERTLRWLDHARTDLWSAIDRLRAREAAVGSLPTTGGDREERESDEMLRHLAGAEVWLAGRLARSARYDGPPRDGDIVIYLEATRMWAKAQIRELHGRDPALAGTDGKGETWTLAKVLRRLVYHSLDHLGELDRRLN
jgi:hypothetical protein